MFSNEPARYLHVSARVAVHLGVLCSLLAEHLVQDRIVRVRLELVALTFVEFVLEFHPVKTQRVQRALQRIHTHDNAEGRRPEHGEYQECLKC